MITWQKKRKRKEKQVDTEKAEDKMREGFVSYQLNREWSKTVWHKQIELRRRGKQTQQSTTS